MARVLGFILAALLTACGTETDLGQVTQMSPASLLGEIDPEQVPENIFELIAEVELDETELNLPPEQAAVARDAWELCRELATRLAERGVTFGELYAAILANDEEAAAEMFGYTDAELEAIYKRLVDIAERARAAGFEDWDPPPSSAAHPPHEPTSASSRRMMQGRSIQRINGGASWLR